MQLGKIGAVCLALAAQPTATLAAELSLRNLELNGRDKGEYHDQILYFDLRGPIEIGDAKAVRTFVSKTLANYAPNALSKVRVHLNSKGGSFSEGVELMKAFKQLGIGTIVDNQHTCLSACAIAFLGGTIVNDGSIFQRYRFVEPGAKLGFHAPSLAVGGQGLVPTNLLNTSYASALSALGRLIQSSKKYDIDATLLQKITETPPDKMYVLNVVDDFARWKIGVKMTEQSWRPDRDDIARICSNYPVWAFGGSVLEAEASIKRESPEYSAKKRHKELAAAIKFVAKKKGSLKQFAYVTTLEFEYDEHCILEMVEFRDSFAIGFESTTASPETAISARITSNFGLPRVSRLHALPADFSISRLPK